MQSDVIYRVATLGEVTSEALDELERILAEQATRPSSSPAPLRGGTSEAARSEEHTSELQSLMRISYAVFCLKKQKDRTKILRKHNISREIIHVVSYQTT